MFRIPNPEFPSPRALQPNFRPEALQKMSGMCVECIGYFLLHRTWMWKWLKLLYDRPNAHILEFSTFGKTNWQRFGENTFSKHTHTPKTIINPNIVISLNLGNLAGELREAWVCAQACNFRTFGCDGNQGDQHINTSVFKVCLLCV